MRKFVRTQKSADTVIIEFIRVLQYISGVKKLEYGTNREFPDKFCVTFEADQQAELYLRLKYGMDMYKSYEDAKSDNSGA